jgi:predicted ferric reductase
MNTTKLKTTLQYLPEVAILLFSIGWAIGNTVNYVAIGIIAVILTLLIWKNKILAIVLSVVLGLGSLYMLLALASEYSEFPKGDPAGTKLLLVGSLIFLSLLAMSIIMPFKYFSRKNS